MDSQLWCLVRIQAAASSISTQLPLNFSRKVIFPLNQLLDGFFDSDPQMVGPLEINGWTAEERQFLQESLNEEAFPSSEEAAQVEDEFEAYLTQTYQWIVSRALARRDSDSSSLSSEQFFQALINDVVAARGGKVSAVL